MKILRAAFVLIVVVGLPSCALVEYSDKLVNEKTGRGDFVTQPASIGGIVGFVAGVPLDIAALPVTYIVYRSQKVDDEEGVDPLSTVLFPSFVLWRAGVLVVGTPFDLLEFAFYRAWKDPPAKLQPEMDAEIQRDGAAQGRSENGRG